MVYLSNNRGYSRKPRKGTESQSPVANYRRQPSKLLALAGFLAIMCLVLSSKWWLGPVVNFFGNLAGQGMAKGASYISESAKVKKQTADVPKATEQKANQ